MTFSLSLSFTLGLTLVVTLIPALSQAGEASERAPAFREIAAPSGLIRAQGIVLEVDREEAAIKINHDPIPAMNWPRMTMRFSLKDSSLARDVSKGDVVEFLFEGTGPDYTIVKMQKLTPARGLQ